MQLLRATCFSHFFDAIDVSDRFSRCKHMLLCIVFTVVIVVFDLNEVESLANARTWAEDACKNASDPLVFLVGTKKDLVVRY